MSFEQWRPVWDRVRSGWHTFVIGPDDVPPPPSDLHILQVDCATPLRTNGPLHEAQKQIDYLLGLETFAAASSSAQSRTGSVYPGLLNSSLLEETPGRGFASAFVETCNQLAAWDGGQAAMCFVAVDAADPATCATLSEIISKSHWLRLPLIMLAREIESDTLAELINTVRSHSNADAVIRIPQAAPASTGIFSWSTLPPETLQVLRAGAIIGTRFEADLLARLLDKSTNHILEQLQYAADAGAPLTDQGQGYLSLTPAAIAELQKQILPSLQDFWHRRLGELLGEQKPETEPPDTTADTSDNRNDAVIQPPENAPASVRFVDLFEPTLAPMAQEPSSESAMHTAAPPMPPTGDTSRTQSTISEYPSADKLQPDQARAAAHLEQAGQAEAAVQQYLAGMRELAVRGDVQRAYLLAQQALQLLDGLPESGRRALLRAELLLELGQIQWQGYAQGAHFTLAQALESLQTARTVLPDETPAELLGQLATVTAGVCYDLGDLKSLERALNELTKTSRSLLAAGASLQAACLLSDQAAIYVRLGDPVQATHLLNKALRLFERLQAQGANEAHAEAELAQVHHLFARLPLHARIRSGRDQDAYSIGIEHALTAERLYRQINQHRDLARVWETMGRLELYRGRTDIAQERLTAAIALQRQLLDITGLARSSAALAELFAIAGQTDKALDLLADSIALNHEKGSPIGLAFNRQMLSVLATGLKQHAPDKSVLNEKLAAVENQLTQAEAMFGQVTLPETGNSMADSEQ